jgi:tetratricopeptide (TPR) repeat protein
MRKGTILIFFLTVTCLGFNCFLCEAQILPPETMDTGLGGNNTITGTVLISNGGRLERRVNIRLQTPTKGDRTTTTDEYGNFAFRGLVSGDYILAIDKEKDLEPFSQTVTIIQVRGFPGQTYNLSVRLTPRPNSQPKPAVLDAAFANLPEQGRALFVKSKDLETAGDDSGAITQLLLLTNEFPDFMLGFNELGVEYLRTNQLAKADAAFQAAIKLDAEAFQSKFNHGMTLVMMKRYSDAEPVLRSAKAINEQSGPVKYFLGTALANLGKFEEAEKELSVALSMGGNEMVEGHRILAIIYSSKGDKKRAAAEIDAYLKINPTAPDAEQLQKISNQMKGLPTTQGKPNP